MTEADNIFAPEMPLAFDEAGHPVAVSHPVYEPDESRGDDARKDFQEKIAGFLGWMASGSVRQAGRRAILLAHLAGKSGCLTDRQLAKKLNISPGRISQLRSEIIGDFGGLGRCNRRQN